MNPTPTTEEYSNALSNFLPITAIELGIFKNQNSNEITISIISEYVCEYFLLPSLHLREKTRKREIVQARQMIHYFVKEFSTLSLKAIGIQIGNLDHSTVIHSIEQVNNLCDYDKKYHEVIEILRENIKRKLSLQNQDNLTSLISS